MVKIGYEIWCLEIKVKVDIILKIIRIWKLSGYNRGKGKNIFQKYKENKYFWYLSENGSIRGSFTERTKSCQFVWSY